MSERSLPTHANGQAERQVLETVREELRQLLADRGAVTPGPSDEVSFWARTKGKIAEHNRRAALSGLPPIDDTDDRVTRRIFDEVIRFGPISRYLDDDRVEEIIVNSPERVFLVRRGADGVTRTELADHYFRSDDEVRGLVRRIVAPLGRRLDEASPAVDARLPDGSRLHAIQPPLTSRHVAVTIRKHLLRAQTLADLVRLGTLSADAARFLELAIRAGVNTLVCGGAASGKTTTLNCLGSTLADPATRVITIEDTLELKLEGVLPNCVALEARSANQEGVGQVTLRDLVRHSLRMRPTRLVVGEVRGPEALDMLQAVLSGHEGSLSTIHADSPRDALLRLKTYVLMGAEGLPERAVLELIAAAIGLVVHQRLAPNGQRLIETIFEVAGLEGTTVVGNDLFRRDARGLVWTGVRPRCEAKIRALGLSLPF